MNSSKKQIKVGDLVRLDVDLFENVNTVAGQMPKVISNATIVKHMFNPGVDLSSNPPGFFSDDVDRVTCTMEYNDVAMVLSFSDSSRLSTKVLTSHGWGWLPTAYLQCA